MKKLIISLSAVLVLSQVSAQVGIGTPTPNSSAQLDITSISRGFLMPRMTQAQRDAITTPATGLMIYQTDGTPGYYYYSGGWQQLGAMSGWGLGGNAVSTTDFIGTNNNQPLRFRVNGIIAGHISSTSTLNAAFGYNSMPPTATGINNTAIGGNALSVNSSGRGNTAVGTNALLNSNNNYNTAVGDGTLYNNQSGLQNTAAGRTAMYENTLGSYNSAYGNDALHDNQGGNYNTAVGHDALHYNVSGNNNTALGYNAGPGSSFTNLSNTTAIGYNAQVTQSNSLILGGTGSDAVQVGIGNTGPHTSALVEMTSTSKGFLMPRMTQTQRTAISTPANGLLVYQTDGAKGYYYYEGGWQQLVGGWGLDGNTGTTSSNFIGTADNQPLRFKVNNVQAGLLSNNTLNGYTFFGYGAGANTTGSANTAIGFNSLNSTTNGHSNTAIGFNSLKMNISGIQNVAVGSGALQSNIDAGNNTAIGVEALYNTGKLNTNTGYQNTAVGLYALHDNVSGESNVAIGQQALQYNIDGSWNTAIGFQAGPGSSFTNLSNTTVIGYNAKVTQSNSLILGGIGSEAVQVGIGNTAPHASALLEMTSTTKGLLMPRMMQAQRTAISSPATGLLVYQTDGTKGYYYFDGSWQQLGGNSGWGLSGNAGTTGSNFIGTTDDQPLYFKVNGQQAGFISNSSYNSTALGYQTGGEGQFNNVAVGYQASTNSTGSFNTAVGSNALMNNTAQSNTAIGYYALSSSNSGFANTAVGGSALRNNNSGINNAAYGASSLYNNLGGGYNTGLGTSALGSNTNGNNNTAIGYEALYYNNTGSSNTAVGFQAGPANGSTNLLNTTAIGNGAVVTTSNTIQLGNSSVTNINTSGSITANGVNYPSDQRFKYQVRPDVKGLDFIMALKPVTYLFDNKKLADFREGKIKANELNNYVTQAAYTESNLERRTGFLAQQVEQAAQQAGYAFDGVKVPKEERDIYTLNYSSFVVPLVKAVQEQQQIIEAQKKEIDQQKQQLADLLKEVELIKTKLK